ncbi:MAG: diacylglycerol kinase [Candidatus Omnitrophica bacterium]|nr:diacylglycerol kinase [Candidatus Omnitrophota bacterium]MBU4477696.1 diacylglycerol kinase [Candidatus Omnitrophota bacterium]MCG2703893.1 diacylglycerol kinase [Candidatus Omnitrophota bacterium]
MHRRRLFESFNYAIEGFLYVLKTQRNMRLHFLLGTIALLLALYFNFSKLEMTLLLVTISFVFMAEMFNTAVEFVIDLITNEFHPLARIIKDISAGAVFVAAINAAFVGYLLFLTNLPLNSVQTGIDYIRGKPLHISFICLLIVFATVIFSKAKSGRGKPLRGGMPSGHSAISFTIWTITLFISPSNVLIGLVFVLALLVAQSRIRPGYHSFKEVIVGALLGIALTSLIFSLLRL